MVAKSSCINPLSSKNLIAWLKFLSGSFSCCDTRDLLKFNNKILVENFEYDLVNFPWYSLWVTQNFIYITSFVGIMQRAIFTDFMNNERLHWMTNQIMEISEVQAFTMSTWSHFYNTRLNLFTGILQMFFFLCQWSIGLLMFVIQNPFSGINWILKDSIPTKKRNWNYELIWTAKRESWYELSP